MWHGVLMRIRQRSTAWSGGAGSGLARVGTRRAGARARRSQDHYGARERESDNSESDNNYDEGRRRGMGSTPPRAILFIGGPPNLSVAVPSTVQCASTAQSRELRAKIHADFSLRPKSEFRSSAKKTTSGHPDGKSFHKPPRHINIGKSLANHFAKLTKYMTEESEHYMDYPRVPIYLRPHWIQNPKVHKSPATSLDPERDTQNKYTTRHGLSRAVTRTYFAGAEYIARLLLAPGH
jgi:hypothetical protein